MNPTHSRKELLFPPLQRAPWREATIQRHCSQLTQKVKQLQLHRLLSGLGCGFSLPICLKWLTWISKEEVTVVKWL